MLRKKRFGRRKVCTFCADKTLAKTLDYKNPALLKRFITERGRIIPRRISGTCARHQRQLTESIKRARTIALMPYTTISAI
jgi:small subunit ribosomal protein S18